MKNVLSMVYIWCCQIAQLGGVRCRGGGAIIGRSWSVVVYCALSCVQWLVASVVMAGLHSGLSAVLSLSGSDSGRSVIEAD